MDDARYVPFVESESTAFAQIVRSRDLTAPVPSCPGWSLHRLTSHLGRVQRSVTRTLLEPTLGAPSEPLAHGPDGPAVVEWFAEGAAALVQALDEFATASAIDATADPDAALVPTWAGPQQARFWPRRMAHEVAVHRWDADSAGTTGSAVAPLPADLAVDGIDELFDVFLHHRLAPEAAAAFGPARLSLHAEDRPDTWQLRGTGDTIEGARRAPGDSDDGYATTTLRGSASSLLLFLWGRIALQELDLAGDAGPAERWQALIRF